MIATDYKAFLEKKSQTGRNHGFEPIWLPDFLFDFQKAMVQWSIIKGRASMFADCGMGKTPMSLVWAENVARKTDKPVLIIAPLAVVSQHVKEAEKFGVDCQKSRDGKVMPRITVTNYDSLHHFNPDDFAGVVCDESSAIKHFAGERQREVTQFMSKTPYRLLCTATAAPNDYIELGTAAEALGEIGRMDMLSQFFRNDENSLHPIWWGARWTFKQHAEESFWKWVCSWARAMRKPSDLGFADGKFVLPSLTVEETVVKASRPFEGELFPIQARSLKDQRKERRVTMTERCEMVASKIPKDDACVMWCHLNTEGDMLEQMIPDAKQVKGSQSEDEREELLTAFASGQLKRLITKSQITGFGLNWQHCNYTTMFPSHSFEQYYQSVRRFWRFGQTRPVKVDIITTEGEIGVLKNLQRKAEAADRMFDMLVREMGNAMSIERKHNRNKEPEQPSWLSPNK